jgi:hypothetical protein
MVNSKMKGLKFDLFLFNIIMKDKELVKSKDYMLHFNKYGFNITQFFAKHFLNYFSDLFSVFTLFRIWDILLYEYMTMESMTGGNLSILLISIPVVLL